MIGAGLQHYEREDAERVGEEHERGEANAEAQHPASRSQAGIAAPKHLRVNVATPDLPSRAISVLVKGLVMAIIL